MEKAAGSYLLSGIAQTHFEFENAREPFAPLGYHDLFEFSAVESWDDLISCSSRMGSLYCGLATLPVYFDMLAGEASVPPFRRSWKNSLARWDVRQALDWADERNAFDPDKSRVAGGVQYPDAVELTSVWWDAIHLFRCLIALYGISEKWIPPSYLDDRFSVQNIDGKDHLLVSFVDTSNRMQELRIIPEWWTELVAYKGLSHADYRSTWILGPVDNSKSKADLIQKHAKSVLLEVVNEFFDSIPSSLFLDEQYGIERKCRHDEDRILVSKLFFALAGYMRDKREVGLCPECGALFDKSQSRGTERMYCTKPSCKVKASQKRKRFVRECKVSGESVEYAVVQLGEPYRESVERWWVEI